MIGLGGVIPSATGVVLLARVLGNQGVPVTQASLSAIAWTLTDLTTPAALSSGAFAVASVVFDALQQADPRWTRDSAAVPGPDGRWGYNFLATLPAGLFAISPAPTVGLLAATPVRYQADVAFTPAAGEPFRQVFQWTRQRVWG